MFDNQTTLPSAFRTVASHSPFLEPTSGAGPWLAPGKVGAGRSWSKGEDMTCGLAGLGNGHLKGVNMLELPKSDNPVIWKRGYDAEVAFVISTNHARQPKLGFNLRGIHFPDTPVGAQKWGA